MEDSLANPYVAVPLFFLALTFAVFYLQPWLERSGFDSERWRVLQAVMPMLLPYGRISAVVLKNTQTGALSKGLFLNCGVAVRGRGQLDVTRLVPLEDEALRSLLEQLQSAEAHEVRVDEDLAFSIDADSDSFTVVFSSLPEYSYSDRAESLKAPFGHPDRERLCLVLGRLLAMDVAS